MSIFDTDTDIDFDDVEALRFENVPAGIYGAVVSDIEDTVLKNGKRAGMKCLVFTYTVTDADDERWVGKSVKEFKTYTTRADGSDYDGGKGLGYIKARFEDLGMPKDYKGVPDRESFLELDVVLTLKERDGYTNVNKVELAGSANDAGDARSDEADRKDDEENPFGF